MARVTLMKTSSGVYLMGTMQCCNGAFWDAEGCFKYCQEDSEFLSQHQASKLIYASTKIGHDKVEEQEWWKNRNNFIDLELNINIDQNYKDK